VKPCEAEGEKEMWRIGEAALMIMFAGRESRMSCQGGELIEPDERGKTRTNPKLHLPVLSTTHQPASALSAEDDAIDSSIVFVLRLFYDKEISDNPEGEKQ
jgi:hypothetical protein